MIRRGWLGEKTGGGFYRKQDGEILVLDPATMTYRPLRRPKIPAVEAVRDTPDFGRRLRALLSSGDRTARFLRRVLVGVLAYAARRVPEIADDPADVDRAMRWGFAWELGPFETWDALGVRELAGQLEAGELPPLVRDVLEFGVGTFYRRNGVLTVFDPLKKAYRPVRWPPGVVVLSERKAQGAILAQNAGASLVDLGDGVACLELHGPHNTIGEDALGMLEQALREMPNRLTEMQERANALLAESRRILQETRQELQSTIEALRQAAEAQAERLRRSATRPEGEGQPPTG